MYASGQNGTTMRTLSQKILNAFIALCHITQLLPLSKVTAPYILFDQQVVLFTLLSLGENVFAPITQSSSLNEATGTLSGPDGGDLGASGGTRRQ